MVGWGIFLIILGAGSLLLPSFGIQFQLMELVDDYQPYAGIVVAIIGAALVLLGMNRGQPATTVQAEPAPAPAPPQAPAETAAAGNSWEDRDQRP